MKNNHFSIDEVGVSDMVTIDVDFVQMDETIVCTNDQLMDSTTGNVVEVDAGDAA